MSEKSREKSNAMLGFVTLFTLLFMLTFVNNIYGNYTQTYDSPYIQQNKHVIDICTIDSETGRTNSDCMFYFEEFYQTVDETKIDNKIKTDDLTQRLDSKITINWQSSPTTRRFKEAFRKCPQTKKNQEFLNEKDIKDIERCIINYAKG